MSSSPSSSSLSSIASSSESNTALDEITSSTYSLAISSVRTVPTNVRYRYSRRPFVHIVVLFGGDARMMRYAKDVQNAFLENGVDVYLHSKIENTGRILNTFVNYLNFLTDQ